MNTKKRTLIIPDGNYTEDDLIAIINFTLNQPAEDGTHGINGLFLDREGKIVNEMGNIIDASGNISWDYWFQRLLDLWFISVIIISAVAEVSAIPTLLDLSDLMTER